jgi:hypothetical protein
VKTLFWLLIFGFGAYVAYQFAMPQIRAWRYRDSMTQAARLARANTKEQVRESLLDAARDLEVPLTSRGLRIEESATGKVRIRATWDEVVAIRVWRFAEWVDTLHYSYEVSSTERLR